MVRCLAVSDGRPSGDSSVASNNPQKIKDRPWCGAWQRQTAKEQLSKGVGVRGQMGMGSMPSGTDNMTLNREHSKQHSQT
jgi:hypothetical protein